MSLIYLQVDRDLQRWKFNAFYTEIAQQYILMNKRVFIKSYSCFTNEF